MTTPDPKRRDIAAESAASVASQQEFMKNFHAEQLKSLAGPAAVMAIAAGFAAKDRMRQAEAQNAAMLDQQQMLNHQMWIQNQLLSGRSMSDIQDQIAAEDAQAQAAPPATSGTFVAWFLGVLILTPYLTWSALTQGYGGWAAIFMFIGLSMLSIMGLFWAAWHKVEDEGSAATADAGSMTPNTGSGEHSQWVDDFRTEQASKQKDDPPTD